MNLGLGNGPLWLAMPRLGLIPSHRWMGNGQTLWPFWIFSEKGFNLPDTFLRGHDNEIIHLWFVTCEWEIHAIECEQKKKKKKKAIFPWDAKPFLIVFWHMRRGRIVFTKTHQSTMVVGEAESLVLARSCGSIWRTLNTIEIVIVHTRSSISISKKDAGTSIWTERKRQNG